jgi:hypothetical protein
LEVIQHGASLVAAAYQLEQHAGFGFILADIGDVVEDEQVILQGNWVKEYVTNR